MPTRINPNFKRQVLSETEKEEFINELFDNLFDSAPIDSNTDKVPDFRSLPHVA